MAYNTRPILYDASGKPIPQVWDEAGDQYRPALGDADGAQHITAADGKIVALGSRADVAVTDPTLSASEISLLKGMLQTLRVDGVQLSGSKEDVVIGNHDDSIPVPAGDFRSVRVYASEGRIAEPIVYGFWVEPPPNATTGTHRMIVGVSETAFVFRLLEVEAVYDKPIIVQRGVVYGEEYNFVNPADKAAQATSAQRLAINNDVPLVFYYQNNTDAEQTNTRTIRTVRLERAYVPW